jgi:hypothetical protein
VLVCGQVSIVLGYRLFVKGLDASGSGLEAGATGVTLKLSNVAPGTFFALFGSAIIATLIWTAPTQIVIPKDTSTAQAGSTPKVEQGDQGIIVRGQ